MSGTTTPHYKLYYFGIRGRGEPVRYMFAAAEVPYEDQLVPFQQWTTIKPTMTPFHSMPVLEIDHKERIGQHVTICRYLAKRFGLAGKDAVEQAKADMYVDGTNDLYGSLSEPLAILRGALLTGKDPTDGFEAIAKWCNETLTPWLTLYTGFLEDNPAKFGWFVGDRLTWADLFIAEFLTRVQMWNSRAIEGHPKIQGLLDRVHSVPGIAKRVQNRQQHLSSVWGGNNPPPI